MKVEDVISLLNNLIVTIGHINNNKPDPVKSEHERFMDQAHRTHLDFSHVFDEQVREDNRRIVEEQFRQTSNLF